MRAQGVHRHADSNEIIEVQRWQAILHSLRQQQQFRIISNGNREPLKRPAVPLFTANLKSETKELSVANHHQWLMEQPSDDQRAVVRFI